MTKIRPQAFGPKWREHESPKLDQEKTFVFCCCGVVMQFHWPRGSETIRCFGCGARFDRPEHFPARSRLTWVPPSPPNSRWRGLIARVQARHLVVLALGLLALGILTTGLVLLWN